MVALETLFEMALALDFFSVKITISEFVDFHHYG